jgi:spermidine synthase
MKSIQPSQLSRQTAVFAGTILLSAFLLFLIQPLISRYILPWFGGGTAVWTAAMMFFQVILLGGYLYAHGLSHLARHVQARIHAAVILVTGAWLVISAVDWRVPLLAGSQFRPASADYPLWDVLRVLSVSVGLPYFLLSTTSSLVQFWYGRTFQGAQPYRFYVLSNAASLAALLSYPLIFEPLFALKGQAIFWTVGFGFFLLFLAFSMFGAVRSGRKATSMVQPVEDAEEIQSVPGWRAKLGWIFLAACASIILLAGTNELTQDIASVPFLWVLPLSLYLLTFMLGFSERIKLPGSLLIVLTLAGLGLAIWAQFHVGTMDILVQIGINAAVIFFACLFCHREVYLRRPAPRHLTSFYLMISIGGAFGGVFVNLIAPLIFEGYWEYHIGLGLAAVAATVILYLRRDLWLWRLRIPVAVIALSVAGFLFAFPFFIRGGSVWMERNFYGILRVRRAELDGLDTYRMLHGTTLHGLQAIDEPNRMRPTTYFTELSGIGMALQTLPRRMRTEPVRVGVIGLGVGTLAAYGQEGDVFRFYELDPAVIRLAQNSQYFSYLGDSAARIETIPGDARLALERELGEGSQEYDLLVVDAFSGDSIPVHLLTEEAVDVYLKHLIPEGVLAIHISNKHVHLEPVVARLQEAYGLEGVIIESPGSSPLGNNSTWVLLSRDPSSLNNHELQSMGREIQLDNRVRLWTDDYSNLFQVVWWY